MVVATSEEKNRKAFIKFMFKVTHTCIGTSFPVPKIGNGHDSLKVIIC